MIEVFVETLLDTLRAAPFLFVIYICLEYVQKHAGRLRMSPENLNRIGPVAGSVLGCVPQCGFSAAAAALYGERVIKGGTLIAVFLATSDEALPVLLASAGSASLIAWVILLKLVIGVIAGYALNATLFYRDPLLVNKSVEVEYSSCEADAHHANRHNLFFDALFHTLKITAYIFATLLFINLCISALGEERFSVLLLNGNTLQPLVTAAIGMIPGCSISVLISQLLINGQISFGSAVAGLCTGAGFGYVVLLRGDARRAAKVLGTTYVCGAAFGFLMNAFAV